MHILLHVGKTGLLTVDVNQRKLASAWKWGCYPLVPEVFFLAASRLTFAASPLNSVAPNEKKKPLAPRVLILRKRPPKPYKLLNFFISFVTTVKSRHAPTICKNLRWKSLCLSILKSITETIKIIYDCGGRCLTIRDVCMDFEPYFKVHNVVSVDPKSITLGQMTSLNMIFCVLVSV